MTKIEFITGRQVGGLSGKPLYDFVLERILDDRIIILEKDLDPQQQMAFIARALEKVNTSNGTGINFHPIFITTEIPGLIRNKHQKVQFNLITPGASEIVEIETGKYSVKTQNGDLISANI